MTPLSLQAAFWHALQYPSETSEGGRYYSGYTDKIHEGESYTAYSIWDTFRAEWPFEILFAPERIGGIVTSMLQDYRQEGWLPLWKNIVETNIMARSMASCPAWSPCADASSFGSDRLAPTPTA